MRKILLGLVLISTHILVLSGCDSSKDSGISVPYGVRFEPTDDMDTTESFSPSHCPAIEGDQMCATPSEYSLGLDSVNLVDCSGACTIASNNQGFSNDRGSLDFESFMGIAAIIAGSTYTTSGERDPTFRSARGVTVNMRYVEAVFPDDSSVEAAYRGASVRLCLVTGCSAGAARGDYVVKLSGESTYKWYNLDTDALVSTKPTNFLKEADVAASSLTGVGFSGTQGIVPNLLDAALDPLGAKKNVVVKVDVGGSLVCDDSSQNGVCSPSADGEAFWIHFPPETFEFSLDD
jgi:hypothetical protein